MAKPSKRPEWAYDHSPQAPGSTSGDLIEPSEAKRHDGWDKEMPPYQWFNWVLWIISKWIDWLDKSEYETLAVAAADLSPGDTAVIRTYDDGQNLPGTLLDYSDTGKFVASLESDGQYVAIAQGSGAAAEVKLVGRTDFTAVINTYTLSATPTGTISRVRCDGEHVVVAYDTKVDVFERDGDGTAISTYDHGAAVNDICIDATFCYLGGAADGSGDEVVRFYLSNGTKSGSYSHGAAVNCLAVGGRQNLYIGGEVEAGSGSDYTTRILDANTLNVQESRSTDPVKAIALDTEWVYIACDGGSGLTQYLQLRSLETYRELSEIEGIRAGSWSGAGFQSMAVDDKYLACGTTDGYVTVFNKRTLGIVWELTGGADSAVVDLDGEFVFEAVTAAAISPGYTIGRRCRPSYNRLWMRTDSTERWSPPYKRLMIPTE